MTSDLIRPRRVEDVAELGRVLAEQQPASRYPVRWPLPFPLREFIQRPGELMAWSAVRDETPVGHVCVQRPASSNIRTHADVSTRASSNAAADAGTSADPGAGPSAPGGGALEELTRVWSVAHGRPVGELAVVSALFTATRTRGSGLGGRLLDTAVAWILARGLAPCLDVVPGPGPAVEIYRAKGWQVAGELRPGWLGADMPAVLAMVLPAATPAR